MANPPPGQFDAALLRHAREAAGLTRPQLAERIGAHATLIQSWETKGVCPTVSNIARVAAALGLTVADLYKPDSSTAGTLSNLRVTAGLTQREVAKQLGIGQKQISRWEAGKARPTWEQITRYATALGVEPKIVAAAVDATESRFGTPTLPQGLSPEDVFTLTESSPHVIYEFDDPAGQATVTSPQFPDLRFRAKFATPSMLELATLNVHVEASYLHRYNHFQWRCSAINPSMPTYLIRWLDPTHERSEGRESRRPRTVDALIANAPLWRTDKVAGPTQPLSTGEYLVIVVEPTDTVQFILDQLLPGEPAALIPTHVDDTVRAVNICLGDTPSSDPAWNVGPGEIDRNTTYADWVQQLRRRGDDPAIDLTAVGTAHADIATDTQPPLFSAPITLAGIQQEVFSTPGNRATTSDLRLVSKVRDCQSDGSKALSRSHVAAVGTPASAPFRAGPESPALE